jgi:hypothetical protein
MLGRKHMATSNTVAAAWTMYRVYHLNTWVAVPLSVNVSAKMRQVKKHMLTKTSSVILTNSVAVLQGGRDQRGVILWICLASP